MIPFNAMYSPIQECGHAHHLPVKWDFFFRIGADFWLDALPDILLLTHWVLMGIESGPVR